VLRVDVTLVHVRCISWNHGYNTGYFDGSHRAWHQLLDDLGGDVLLLQETTIPEWVPSRGYASFLRVWESRLWGCAVFTPDPHEVLLADPKHRVLAVRSRLGGIGELVLGSFHAGIPGGRVIPALRASVEALVPFLEGNRFILGGDLNTARGAAEFWPGHGHAEFFDWLEDDLGWHDCHWRMHGREQVSLWSPGSRPLQADHIFVDAETAKAVRDVRVIDNQTIRGISDHGPVTVDLGEEPN
jgi:hypothetical protein